MSAEASAIHAKFSRKPASEHIATPIAVEALFRLFRERAPQRILEIGAGIGTFTDLILQHSNAHVDALEDHPFCISEFKNNVSNWAQRVTLYTDYDRFIPSVSSYDLIIVDGGTPELIKRVIEKLDSVGSVFVEGKREHFRVAARKALAGRHVFWTIDSFDPQRRWKGANEIRCMRLGVPLVTYSYAFVFENILRAKRKAGRLVYSLMGY